MSNKSENEFSGTGCVLTRFIISMAGVTLWGYRDGEIWRDDAYLLRSDGSARPAMPWLMEYVGAVQYP